MKFDLRDKTNEEISDFVLNNKKADLVQLSPTLSDAFPEGIEDPWTHTVVYDDGKVKIEYSVLEIAKDDIMQNITIYSAWWGRIKNSQITLEGFSGKSTEILCGRTDVGSFKSLEDCTFSKKVPINNKNKSAHIEITNFDSFCKAYQRTFGQSPSCRVTNVISQSPSLVEVEIEFNGDVKYITGVSKRDAADKFAAQNGDKILSGEKLWI